MYTKDKVPCSSFKWQAGGLMIIMPFIIIVLHELAKQAIFHHYLMAGLIYVLIPIVAMGTSCLGCLDRIVDGRFYPLVLHSQL